MSDNTEYSSLLKPQPQSDLEKPKSSKCRNYSVVTLLLLALTAIIVYYASNSKVNGNIVSQNAIKASGKLNKITVTRENLDLNKITQKIKLSDNDELTVKLTQLNSHVLKATLYHEKEKTLTTFSFDADEKEIEIAKYKDASNLKKESRIEYFKTSKDTKIKGNYLYQYNEESISLTKDKKKDEEFQKAGFNKMDSFIQSWSIPIDISLLSVKIGSYGLTGKSSHAIRYLHAIASHFHSLQKNVKYPEYFTTMINEVNAYMNGDKTKKINDKWFWSSSSDDDDYSFTVGDTGDDCAADEDSDCFVSNLCWVDNCTIDDLCDNECFGLCGAGCTCWSWVCGDCDCHCLCKLHDHACSCSFWGYLDSCCYNIWYWLQGCCA